MKRSTLVVSAALAAALLGGAWLLLGPRAGTVAADGTEVVVHKDPG